MTEKAAAEQLLYTHLGEPVLAYLLNLTPDQIPRIRGDASVELAPEQLAVLDMLLLMDGQLTVTEDHDQFIAMNWRSRLTEWHEPSGLTIGSMARQFAGGTLQTVEDGLPLASNLLAQLAVESYPALLVKEPDSRFGLGSIVSLFRHPLSATFQEVAREDKQLRLLFTEDSETTGPTGSTLRSTGQGSSHQLWMFAETMISSGWRLARSRNAAPTDGELVDATLESLDVVRTALLGESVTVPVRIGLAGVLLPEGENELAFECGRLRRSDERDSVFVRSTSLEGQLSAIDDEGESIVINYSGDLVLEVEVPYVVMVRQLDFGSPWPDELNVVNERIEEVLENVRLGLLLALPEIRPVVVSTWRAVLDPLSQGSSTGWSDVSRTPGLTPLQLTAEQADEWKQWTERVGSNRIPTVSVAIRRMLAAASERSAPEDVLVDAVIVWENLFGAKTETTLRVTSSLAWLLGDSADDRLARQTRYKKIYGGRSDLVHGAATVRPEQTQEYSIEAVKISIDALRAVFTTHLGLLDEKTSEGRSLRMLHEG